jgi:predicted nucleotidyltransferase
MSDAAIVWKRRRPLGGMAPEIFERSLRERLQGRVEGAYFFGSYASGALGPDSYVDLILVARTEAPFTRRAALFDDLYDLLPALDLLVYTPEEFAEITADPS